MKEETPTTCSWLVRDPGPPASAPWEAHENFGERSAEAGPVGLVVECGGDVDPGGRWALCEFHTGAMEIPSDEFETLVEEGRSWS